MCLRVGLREGKPAEEWPREQFLGGLAEKQVGHFGEAAEDQEVGKREKEAASPEDAQRGKASSEKELHEAALIN